MNSYETNELDLNPSLWKIALWVILGHVLTGALLIFNNSANLSQPKKKESLVVKTITLKAKKTPELIPYNPTPTPQVLPKPESIPEPIPEPVVELKAQPQIESKPKKTLPTKPKVKTPAKPDPKPLPKLNPKPQEKTAQDKKLDKKKEELLLKAQSTLSKIKTTPSKEVLKVPDKLGSISEMKLDDDDNLSQEERSYRDELALRLKLLLKLPEYGLVKLRLSLGSKGNVTHVKVLSSASQVNRKHIEKILPTLSFPPLNKSNDITFHITLSSD